MVRVLLTLLIASLVVVWLVSTRLPQALQAPPLTATAPESPEPLTQSRPERGALYIWRDARGVTHIESDPPPAGVQPDVVSFVRSPSGGDTVASRKRSVSSDPETLARHPLSVYTLEGFEALMQQVERMAHRLEERDQRVGDLSKQL